MRDPIENLKLRLEQAREAQHNLASAWADALAAHNDAEIAAALDCLEDRVWLIRDTAAKIKP